MNTHSSIVLKIFVHGERIQIKYIFMEKIISLIRFETFATKYKKTLKYILYRSNIILIKSSQPYTTIKYIS